MGNIVTLSPVNCEEQIYSLKPAVMLKILILVFALFVLLSPTVAISDACCCN